MSQSHSLFKNAVAIVGVFFVATTCFFVSAQIVRAQTSPTVDVKVLGIFSSGPVVGGNTSGFADGTTVSLKVRNSSEVVVGSLQTQISDDMFGPRSIPSTLVGGQNYTVTAEILNPFQEVVASASQIFRSVGISNVTVYNATPTSVQLSITSFGGDQGQNYGLLPGGEPGRSARLRYKPFIPGIVGALIYEFLPENYIDFPLNPGVAPGSTIQQVLLGLTPHTTYSYKISLAPIDEDENGQNDNYQTFIIPTPEPSDFIYSEFDGPLLWRGGFGTALPTFATLNVNGTGGGGNNNGGGNGTQVFPPSLDITNVIVHPTSVDIQGTVDHIPLGYTTTIFVYVSGHPENPVNPGGTPVATGPQSFNVTVSGLAEQTTYRYKFTSAPSGGTGQTIHFSRPSWVFTTIGANQAPIIATPSDSGPATGTTSDYTSGANGGLVPCNGTTVPCTFEKLIELVQDVMDFLIFTLALPIAAIALAYAGIQFIVSGGNTEARSKAKSIFGSLIIGFIIALAAWLIVNTILAAFGIDSAWTAGWISSGN